MQAVSQPPLEPGWKRKTPNDPDWAPAQYQQKGTVFHQKLQKAIFKFKYRLCMIMKQNGKTSWHFTKVRRSTLSPQMPTTGGRAFLKGEWDSSQATTFSSLFSFSVSNQNWPICASNYCSHSDNYRKISSLLCTIQNHYLSKKKYSFMIRSSNLLVFCGLTGSDTGSSSWIIFTRDLA